MFTNDYPRFCSQHRASNRNVIHDGCHMRVVRTHITQLSTATTIEIDQSRFYVYVRAYGVTPMYNHTTKHVQIDRV